MSNAITDEIKNIRRTKDPKKVVRKAAELLAQEPERWTKGSWIVDGTGNTFDSTDYFNQSCNIENGVCKVCLEGALLVFSKDAETYERAKELVKDTLRSTPSLPGRRRRERLYQYNDASGRTADDIVELLKVAAK